jgi:hypothetical protein
MASGMTVIDAINEIIETVGEFPLASTVEPVPDGTGTSIYHRARSFLNREDTRIQSLGWPENTVKCASHTASGGFITINDTVLRVRSEGKSGHRNLVIRHDATAGVGFEQRLYDADNGTFTFTSTEQVFLDTVSKLSFENLPPLLQDVIVAKSKMEFQRRIQGNAQVDHALNQEYVTAEMNLDRIRPDWQQPFNIQPMIPSSGGGATKQAKPNA